MAHAEQRRFCTSVKEKFPERFKNASVLDVGSLDINGNNRYLFEDCRVTGIDIGPGRNVDVVTPCHLFVPAEPFDIVLSTECLEHDPHWVESLQAMVRFTKPGGLLVITCATTGRPEHGTSRTDSFSSPLTSEKWGDYYRNVTEKDVRSAIGIRRTFSSFEFSVEENHHNLFFWGTKRLEPYEGIWDQLLKPFRRGSGAVKR